jgi:pimeloyl-ACP methyl ester carboxylesterase
MPPTCRYNRRIAEFGRLLDKESVLWVWASMGGLAAA